MNDNQLDYYKKLTELVYKVLAQNVASQISGKMEIWFENGYVTNFKNAQSFGLSIMEIERLVLFGNEEN